MAERRMFAKTIIDSDHFLDMPMTAQCLYFHLGMRADDEGFVNSPRIIQRMVGASSDDLNLLVAKGLIIKFDSGVVAIKHWKIHNYIRGDRLNPTAYQDERESLVVDKNGSYVMCQTSDSQMSVTCQSNVRQLTGMCQPSDSIGKDRIGQDRDRIDKDRDRIEQSSSVSYIVEEWNKLAALGIKPITKMASGTKRYDSLVARLNQYGEKEIVSAIEKIKDSDFLQGKTGKGFMITFDWFVKPNNFPKVLEGQYDTRKVTETRPKQSKPNRFHNAAGREYSDEFFDDLESRLSGVM